MWRRKQNGRWPTLLIVSAAVTGLSFGASSQAGAWSLEEASTPYKGQSIRVICDGYSPCLAYQQLAKEFADKTGIGVSVEVADLLQVQQQILTDALTGTQVYDVAQIISWSVGVWGAQQFATPLSKFLENPKLHDPAFAVSDFVPENFQLTSVYEGQVIGVPFHYIPPYAIYRKDIAGDPGERAAFKAKYGYDLPLTGDKYSTVDTWEHWRDIAEFFTRKAGDKVAGVTRDTPLYGVTAAFKRHLTVLYDYERILLGMGGEVLDADGNVKLDSPEALKALEYMLSWRKFSPPSYQEYTWDQQYSDFCAGNLFSTFSWGDTTPFLESSKDCPASADKLGYFPHPGTHKTVAEGQGWVIPTKAPHPEAAFLFLQWLDSKDVQAKCQAIGCVTPRSDVLRMSDWDTYGNIVMGRKIMDNGWLYVRPHPPSLLNIQEIMMEELSAAGADQVSAKTAIANMTQRIQKAME
jgi:multiple sugar transport system substrate-binding protein